MNELMSSYLPNVIIMRSIMKRFFMRDEEGSRVLLYTNYNVVVRTSSRTITEQRNGKVLQTDGFEVE
jgi:hypothetical protein